MARPPSRIPRAPSSTATATLAADENAPFSGSTAARSTRAVRASALPLAPSAPPSKLPTSARTRGKPVTAVASTTATLRPRQSHSAAPVAEVVVHHPSSDPPPDADLPSAAELTGASTSYARFHDESEGEGESTEPAVPQMPTPPTSQTPPSEEARLSHEPHGHKSGLLPSAPQPVRRSRSASTQPAPLSAGSTSNQRRTSRSPALQSLPVGPSHAPHVLAAARRRSTSASASASASASTSAYPLPAPPSRSPPLHVILERSAAPLPSTATDRRKGKNIHLRPRPSETLPAPPAPGSGEDDDEEDPLLLLGPEHTRGRGEGKRKRSGRARAASSQPAGLPGPARQVGREASTSLVVGRLGAATMTGRHPASEYDDEGDVVPTYQPLFFGDADQALGPVVQEDSEDVEDLGGFDAPEYHESLATRPAVPGSPSQSSGSGTADRAGVNGRRSDLVDQLGHGMQHDDCGNQDGSDAIDYAPLREGSSSADGHSSPAEEETEGDEDLNSPSDAGTDAGSGHAADDNDDDKTGIFSPAGTSPHHTRRTRPSYPPLSPNRTGEWDGEIPVVLDSSPVRPSRRSVRPSYPPLSPNTTGEFDAVVPVQLGSSPGRSESGEAMADSEAEEEERAEEVDGGRVASQWQVEEVAIKVEEESANVGRVDGTAVVGRGIPASPSTTLPRPINSTPSNLLFASAYRAPSPALSPLPFRSRAAFGSSRSPQPLTTGQLVFASPRSSRLDRLTHLVAPSPSARSPSYSPAPPATAPAVQAVPPPSSASPQRPERPQTWTRGPAFFRSSSFSPPAHAALPKTATLFERRPGHRSGGGADESREYFRPADLTATSPMPEELEAQSAQAADRQQGHVGAVEEGGAGYEDEAENGRPMASGSYERELFQDRQEDERARSRTSSVNPNQADRLAEHGDVDAALPPPTPRKDSRSRSSADPSEDENMVSPGSVSDHESRPGLSPARSTRSDVSMSSPSPRNSPVPGEAAHSALLGSPTPPVERSTRKTLPSTPDRLQYPTVEHDGNTESDARMLSPSPARSKSEQVQTQEQGSPLKARIGDLVEGGRNKLQGLLFGPKTIAPRAVANVPEARSSQDSSDAASSPEALSKALEGEEGSEDDESFPPSQERIEPGHPHASTSFADSTFASQSNSHSYMSSAPSNTTTSSRRAHHHRRRPSHPTLPVIEITSTDARAAARAAAILKVHHKYVEQGISAVDAATAAANAFDEAEAAAIRSGEDAVEESDEEDEEELRTLLLDAEDELREQLPGPRPRAASSVRSASTVSVARWTSLEWRKLEQILVELGRRQRRGTSIASSVGGRSMGSESIALASVTGDEIEPDTVVEAFLRSSGVTRDECQGEWAWEKLIVRVDALKARRAKDARQRRATSFASTAGAGDRVLPTPQEVDEAQRASPEEDSPQDPSPDASAVVVKEEQLSDAEESAGAAQADGNSGSSDEEAYVDDDTFFASSSREVPRRRTRRGSIEPVYAPTALANPALRHLYDDFPLEKPKLPLKDFYRGESPTSAPASEIPHSDDIADKADIPVPRDSTPDAIGSPPKSPSSAQRLMSYLGSFVRRSPGPSPASSTRALPADSSASPYPSPEMQQVRLSAAIVTPEFASTAKPYPPLPAAATHKPLPPIEGRLVRPLPHGSAQPPSQELQYRTDASSSRVTLDADSSTGTVAVETSGSSAESSRSILHSFRRRRRRSSGSGGGGHEGSRVWAVVDAIEEAESSREEEESRIIELLRHGSAAKRRAASGDLRRTTDGNYREGLSVPAKGPVKGNAHEAHWRGFVEIEHELERTMIPTGTRALDRRVSGERRTSRR